MKVVLFLSALMMYGCGEVNQAQPSAITAQQVDQQEEHGYAMVADTLPPCTPASQGALVYYTFEEQFKTCDRGSWVTIELKGEQGEQGEKGDKGDTGEQGEKGEKGDKGDTGESGTSENLVNRIVSCGGSNDIGVADWRYGVETVVTEFYDGSYQIECMSLQRIAGEDNMDSSTMSYIFTADSNAVAVNEELVCFPMYVSVYYDLSTEEVTYVNDEDDSFNQTISCSEIYPGN